MNVREFERLLRDPKIGDEEIVKYWAENFSLPSGCDSGLCAVDSEGDKASTLLGQLRPTLGQQMAKELMEALLPQLEELAALIKASRTTKKI